MLLVSSSIRNERLDICRKCKHFVKTTQTCGTLAVGNTVKYKNTTKKLCGCIMPIKTHLKISSCPLHKWKSTIAKEDIKAIKKLLGDIHPHKITREQNKTLTELYNKALSKKSKVSNCGKCVKSMINELKEMLKDE